MMEAKVKQRRERQFDLFDLAPTVGAIPTSIEEELVELLAQMLEATIFSAGSPTEDGDE